MKHPWTSSPERSTSVYTDHQSPQSNYISKFPSTEFQVLLVVSLCSSLFKHNALSQSWASIAMEKGKTNMWLQVFTLSQNF